MYLSLYPYPIVLGTLEVPDVVLACCFDMGSANQSAAWGGRIQSSFCTHFSEGSKGHLKGLRAPLKGI